MSRLLEQAQSVAQRLLPALVEEMGRTGHIGHCIYVARVVERVLSRFDIPSEALCVDYEFMNSTAVQQLEAGEEMQPPARIVRTGFEDFDGYPHHVVTIVPDGQAAVFLDPTIIQLRLFFESVDIHPLQLHLPWPRTTPLTLDLPSGKLTYTFRPGDRSFEDNQQWSDTATAQARADAIVQRMEA